MLQTSILIVDDEKDILEGLRQALHEEDYQVHTASDSVQALHIAVTERPSLILLDIYMPGRDGITLCDQLRNDPVTRAIPVIIMTGRNESEIRIRAFKCGADDFVEKPFQLPELFARIHSKLRRRQEAEPQGRPAIVSASDLSVDMENMRAYIAGSPVDLGFIECRILRALVAQAGNLVKREELEQAVWGDRPPATRSLDTHIASIRKKLDPSRLMLRTVYGKGYILEPDEK